MRQVKRFLANRKLATGLVIMLAILLAGAASNLMAGKDTESKKGYLGVSIESLDEGQKEELKIPHGVRVLNVAKDQAAEKAGIEKGDIILFFNGEKIRRTNDLVDAVRDCKPGSKVTAKVLREGKKKEFAVTVGKYKEPKVMSWVGEKRAFFPGDNVFLGVHLQKMSKDLAEYFGVKEDGGALVMKVEEDSPAEKAGLKAGDVIVKIGDSAISGPGDVSDIITHKEKGDKVALHLMRHKKKKTVTAELDEREGHFGNLRFFGDRGMNRLFDKGFHIESPGVYIYKYKHGGDHEEDVILMEKKYKKKIEEKEKQLKEKMEKHKEKLKEVKERTSRTKDRLIRRYLKEVEEKDKEFVII